MKFIRFKAAAVFTHQGRVLVHQVENKSTGETWYIPPGGGIEYGESSVEALKREIREEFGWSTKDERLIGSFESFHTIVYSGPNLPPIPVKTATDSGRKLPPIPAETCHLTPSLL